ncbi:MAG: glycerophosphoryl diester phosphodiesterase membrane domain-containing protein [Promicromonosporaceae bacterium]|nr:glycerophosphoryl diester phosphodiesterase membrane domain-containing protein [Promicromonosporaceae bacterium]
MSGESPNFEPAQQPVMPTNDLPPGVLPTPRYGQYAAGGGPSLPPAAPLYQPPPQQPGIVPLRPLRLGDIYQGAMRAVGRNPMVMVVLPLLIVLVASIIGALLGQLLISPLTRLFDPVITDPDLILVMDYARLTPVGLVELAASGAGIGFLMLLVIPLIEGIVAIGVSQSVLGTKISMRDAWARIVSRLGALVGWAALLVLVIVVATALISLLVVLAISATFAGSPGFAAFLTVILVLAFVVLAIWLSFKLLFVAPIIVVEKATIRQAISRSWLIGRGFFWRIFGIYLLSSLILSFIAGILGMPFTSLVTMGAVGGGTSVVTASIISIIGTTITTAFTTVFISAITTLLYIDARIRNEGLGNSLATAAAQPRDHRAVY